MTKRLRKNSKKGFTLIELLVVIAVLAILILLALPRLSGFKEKAELARIKNDVKATENYLLSYLVNSDNLPGSWNGMSYGELGSLALEEKLYEKQGLASTIIDGDYKVISEDFIDDNINSKLDGNFFANEEGKVYYASEKTEGLPPLEEMPADYVVASEMDFSWVSGSGYTSESKGEDGYYQYTGTDDYIIIPDTIDGDKLTNYYKMFSTGSSATVKGVSSPGIGIINMTKMFESSPITELDVRYLKTQDLTYAGEMFKFAAMSEINLNYSDLSKLIIAAEMFQGSNIQNVHLENKDLSSVKVSNGMFRDSTISELNFNNANISNVSDASSMFKNSNIGVLNFDNVNMSNLETVYNMFEEAKISTANIRNSKLTNLNTAGYMFTKAVIPTLKLDNIKLINLETAYGMFSELTTDNLTLPNLHLPKLKRSNQMFAKMKVKNINLKGLNLPVADDSWGMLYQTTAENLNFSNVKIGQDLKIETPEKGESAEGYVNATQMFSEANIDELNATGLEIHNANSIYGLFYKTKAKNIYADNMKFDLAMVTTDLFGSAIVSETLSVNNLYIPNLSTSWGAFGGVKADKISFNNANLGSYTEDGIRLDLDSRESFGGTFSGAVAREIVMNNLNLNELKSAGSFFSEAEVSSLTIKNLVAPKAELYGFFEDTILGDLSVDGFSVATANDGDSDRMRVLVNMFKNAKADTISIKNLEAPHVKVWSGAFSNANISKMDISGLDTTGGEDFSDMFKGAKVDNIDLSKMNFDSAKNLSDMFMNVETNNIIAPNLKNNNSYLGDNFMSGAKANKVDLSGLDTTGGEKPQSDNFFAGSVIKEVYLKSQADIDNLKGRPLTPSETIFKVK